jgi:hypothetical protein
MSTKRTATVDHRLAPTFAVVPGPTFPECEPAKILETLASAGTLHRFTRKYGRHAGYCHEVALALVCDLADSRLSVPFKWYVGDCPNIGEHSWIECEGWAIDASNGHKRPIII